MSTVPPHWQRHRPPDWIANRHHKRRFLFIRFAMVFGAVLTFFFVVFAIVLGVAYKPLSQAIPNLAILLAIFCGLPLIFGFVAITAGGMAFRRIGTPFADVMAAADAVAEGDLSVRVREDVPGEFGRLAHSFNRMAAQLAADEEQRRNLTADVAHELRTPLHIIQGNLEGILDGVYEASPEHISATLEETRLLARLVSDLQTLSLAEAGQLQLHREQVSARDLLEDTLTSFAGPAAEAEVELKIEMAEDGPDLELSADPDRLEQVLYNLVANALRYTPEGGKIILRARAIPAGVGLEVADNGRGISAEDLPHIFDRFWKGDRARGHKDGAGSGLGLAIARQLVQAHGGTITAQSAPGQGTTFTIEIKTP
jgi:signal transduction histidine kinase